MEICTCTDKQTWTTSVGAVVCLHCARPDGEVQQPACPHHRSAITPKGPVCVSCGHVWDLPLAFDAFKKEGFTK